MRDTPASCCAAATLSLLCYHGDVRRGTCRRRCREERVTSWRPRSSWPWLKRSISRLHESQWSTWLEAYFKSPAYSLGSTGNTQCSCKVNIYTDKCSHMHKCACSRTHAHTHPRTQSLMSEPPAAASSQTTVFSLTGLHSQCMAAFGDSCGWGRTNRSRSVMIFFSNSYVIVFIVRCWWGRNEGKGFSSVWYPQRQLLVE